MKKILLFLLVALLVAGTAFGATTYRYGDVVQTVRGDALGGATVTVYSANTTNLVTLYSGVTDAFPEITNPTATDGYGRYSFYVIEGNYDVVVSGPNITTYTVEDIRVFGAAYDTPWYDVTDYGAVVDDDLDDTASIQAAIAAADVDSFSVVYFPGGNYSIDASTAILSGDYMTFDLTSGAKLQAIPGTDSSYDILRIEAKSNVTVLGGNFYGERTDHTGTTGQSGMCISIRGSDNVKISGANMSYAWGDGLYIGTSSGTQSTNVFVDNCYFFNNRRQGASLTHADNVVFSSCTFDSTNGNAIVATAQSGVDIEPNAGETVTNVRIANSHFLDNEGDGVLVTGTTGTASDITIIGCTFSGNASETTSRAAIKVFTAPNVSITGNTIMDSDNQGIRVDTSSRCSVSNNSVSNTQIEGVYVKTSTDCTITGNTVHQAGLAADDTYYAYQFISSCDNIQVSGNVSSIGASGNNQKHGIVVESSTLVNVHSNSLESVSATFLHTGTNSVGEIYGSGSPEGVFTAPVGFRYSDYDGAAGSISYLKESGAGNTGWGAVRTGLAYGAMYQHDTGTSITFGAANADSIIGGWTTGTVSDFTFGAASRALIAGSTGVYLVNWGISAQTGTANKDYEFAVSVNDVAQVSSSQQFRVTATTSDRTASGTAIVSVTAGQAIKLVVRNETDTTTLTVNHANLTAYRVN